MPKSEKRGGSPTKILKLLILNDSIMDKENSLLFYGSKFHRLANRANVKTERLRR